MRYMVATVEILVWFVGGLAMFLIVFLILTLHSVIGEIFKWMKRRWL